MYVQPYINFNGFYSENELLQNAEDAKAAFDTGMIGYENFQRDAEHTFNSLNNFTNGLVDSMPAIRKDLLGRKSVVMQEARRGLDQALKNQATRMATISGGGAALQIAQMNKEANKMALESMNQSQINVLKEDMSRKKLYYDTIEQRHQTIGQAQQTMADLVTKWGSTNTAMAQAGLQGQINTIRNLVSLRTTRSAHEIARDRMQVSWNQSLLNSQTNIFRAQMGFQLGRFNSITAAQARMYDAEVRARAAVYAADTEANSANLNAWLGARAAYHQTMMNSNTAEYRALMAQGLGVAQVLGAQQGAVAGQFANIDRSYGAQQEASISDVTNSYGTDLARGSQQAGQFAGAIGGIADQILGIHVGQQRTGGPGYTYNPNLFAPGGSR